MNNRVRWDRVGILAGKKLVFDICQLKPVLTGKNSKCIINPRLTGVFP